MGRQRSDGTPPAVRYLFLTGLMRRSATAPPGDHDYICDVHPQAMVGL